MTIKIIEDKEVWDRFVDQSSDGLLFHKWDSLKIMEKQQSCKETIMEMKEAKCNNGVK